VRRMYVLSPGSECLDVETAARMYTLSLTRARVTGEEKL